ncbi:Phosphocholine cytidylyltransferase / Aspartate aminotransferase [Olavius algarvensis spirochete endosymbiont]|uniref:aminotransferase class I/II-fold pyridoxal phosphate-dependent enzyme n=1 Tax=Olavius algarvensis spirochete endosymbiont TaxID=260710 RepID=UPI000F0F9C9F|nr:aminotransferase class I/II-fold pyridoxal phosphate-dependent enzyme [Olavius algarvensis spirochete endosymbiont]VDB00829.1 Phosphocholine cytidylyltransferase / Aspartate aminotransferase [Olavius algarvensis spirochete endosymbiont]
MQAMILAAGMGKRLGEYTDDNTKCMVRIGGTTLIDRMLNNLTRHEISRIILVVGYKGEKVKSYVGSSWNGVKIIYVENPIYDKTNNIYSLYLARHLLLEEETLLLESDLIFSSDVLPRIINDSWASLVLVSRFQSWMNGTVVRIDKHRRIKEFVSGGNFSFQKVEKYFKTVNIYKFSVDFSKNKCLPFLEAYLKSIGYNEYYEQVLSVINFLDNGELRACVLDEKDLWYEIDDKQDLDDAEILFSSEEEKLEKIQNRFGGYWRYPGLTDFCYLVNPFFPNRRLLEELRSNFDILLSEYPSGIDVQNLLASKLFNTSKEYIVTGNGAAELINIIMKKTGIITGFVTPTFNEYHQRIEKKSAKFYNPDNMDFRYGIDELKEFSKGLSRLVLINPDNPSGNFIEKKDVLKLLEYFLTKGIQLILDESFVDFSTEGEEDTLIADAILKTFPNLIVIKSISKSYGIPGLRLGVAASSNIAYLDEIKRGLSIWNINSLAEFFLQIISKYKDKYVNACRKIVRERKRFCSELSVIPQIRAIPSQANFVTCEILGGMTATEFTRALLIKHGVFIKDLTGKLGIPNNKQYIRLAIRNKLDNNKLVAAIKQELLA